MIEELIRHGIRLPYLSAGLHSIYCPKCKSRKSCTLSVAVDPTVQNASWECSECGWSGDTVHGPDQVPPAAPRPNSYAGNGAARPRPKTSYRQRCDDTLADALRLAELGLPVFFCRDDKKPALRKEISGRTDPDGKPIGGFKIASTDPAEIRRQFALAPGTRIGVATGAVSGLAVLDIDPKHPEAVEWMQQHKHLLPIFRIHQTQSGGWHFLMRYRLGLDSTAATINAPHEGVDVRADRGYVIWWPAAGYPVLENGQTPW